MPEGPLYKTMKEFGTLIGAIVGFSGLAWSHFFAVTHPKSDAKSTEQRPEPEPPSADI